MDLRGIKRLVERGEWDYSEKVRTKIESGEFYEEDIEACIASAQRVQKREVDERGTSLSGYKYVVVGRNRSGRPFYTAGKPIGSDEGTVYFIITAHEAK